MLLEVQSKSNMTLLLNVPMWWVDYVQFQNLFIGFEDEFVNRYTRNYYQNDEQNNYRIYINWLEKSSLKFWDIYLEMEPRKLRLRRTGIGIEKLRYLKQVGYDKLIEHDLFIDWNQKESWYHIIEKCII